MAWRSQIDVMLNELPEIRGLFPGRGNIAINILTAQGQLRIAIGERVGKEFLTVAESPWIPNPEALDTDAIIQHEFMPFGEKSKIIDVFAEGFLVREAIKAS